jgi:hypothetical protein
LCHSRDPLWLGGSGTNFISCKGSSINTCRTGEQLELRITRSIATPYQTSSIHKPKIYTGGTVKYGFLIASGGPRNLEDALHDKN